MYLVRSMRKKAVVLVIVCTALAISAVVAFFELVLFTPAQQTVSIGQILLNPDAWVSKEVVVEGNLTGPMVGYNLLWNFELSSNETIGVLWNGRDGTANGSDVYDSVSVKVFGVVRSGTITVEGPRGGYFIDAERIDVI
jgi:hypothetical protein